MNRIGPNDSTTPYVAAMASLHRAGWSIGDVGFTDATGRTTWLVSGSNGENLIRAECANRTEAWGLALDQARSLGMLGHSG